MPARPTTAALLACISLVVAACGSDGATTSGGSDPAPPTTAPHTDPPPPDVPIVSQAALPGEFDVTFRAGLSARIERDDRGCWSLAANGEDVFVVLPVGFEVAPNGGAIVTPDGDAIPVGSAVDANGALFSIDGLPGGSDGRLGSLAARCRPGGQQIVVTDSITIDDFDPTALDDAALAALVEAADLDVDWPCGFGFATSTDDQRVGLYVDPVDFEQPPDGTVTLPDDGWRANLVVGEHLFVNHCDDVAEWFEPDRSVGGTYPLVAGTFEFRAPEPGTAPSDTPVTIVIDGAVVDGPTGPISLGRITIANDAYGFFAG